jgi:hypothetical protein
MEATLDQRDSQELDAAGAALPSQVGTSQGLTLPWQSWVRLAQSRRRPLAVLAFPKGNGPRCTRTPIAHGPLAAISTALCPVGR